MKKLSPCTMVIFFTVLALVFSCKREKSCEGCIEGNKPPIATAGPDQVITLPTDSISLDGSASNDPDGKISEWLWTKISGPASFILTNKSSSKTIAKNLVAGVYQFELKVTDDKGLSAKDTAIITVDSIPTTNHPPVACAGPDLVITLPANIATLDGSCSTDPDNNIVSYAWSKISGPSVFNIANINAIQTEVNNLVEGIYQFELKVTDAGGALDKDTVQVRVNAQLTTTTGCDNSNRPTVSAQLIPVGNLSMARMSMSVASAGNKILFAGGDKNGVTLDHTSRVDIFDLTTQSWSTAELCAPRNAIAAVALGSKIFFGGGEYGDGTWPVDSVDIFDVSTNTWTVGHLSTAGNSIGGTTVGNKVLFAGGDGGFAGRNRETTVDIYDLSANTWSIASLSDQKRGWLSALTAGNKVYIAGGETMTSPSYSWDHNWGASNKIDVYDNSTNTWSVSTMFEGKMGMGSIAVNDKIYWAGGSTGNYPNMQNSCVVEIRDVNAGNSSIEYLFKPGWRLAVIRNNKIVFLGGDANKFDIYDIATHTWSIGVLVQPIPGGASAISVNNTIYIAGGAINGDWNNLSNQVWKLEF